MTGDIEALVEEVAYALFECEVERSRHAQSVLQAATGKECAGILMEPYEECGEVFRSDARALIPVFARYYAQVARECGDARDLGLVSARGMASAIAAAIEAGARDG